MTEPHFEPKHFEPKELDPSQSKNVCGTVAEAMEAAIHGEGIAAVYPFGLGVEERAEIHREATSAEYSVGNGELTRDVLYYTGVDPKVYEPLFSKLLTEPDTYSEPMVVANIQYMVYPPGSSLAPHYDFASPNAMTGELPEESITVIYIVGGSKRLGFNPVANPTDRAELTQAPDMLVLIRGAAIQDGTELRLALRHWVPELTYREISAVVTFDLMPERLKRPDAEIIED